MNINNMSIIKLWRDIWNIEGQSMCQCIQNEASVQNITVHPNVHKDGNHRFFGDDIPYGLCYIKHYALILNIQPCFAFIDRA